MKALAMTLTAAIALSAGASAQPARSHSRFSTSSSRIDNPWFPLRVGTKYEYTGKKDGKRARDVLTVTSATKIIAGVRTREIDDRLYLDGRLEERTTDWYAQDRSGNVWYFGEKTAELRADGTVKSTEGSWQAGRDGARAGVYMPGRPRVGQTGRQEFYKGHAEDHFQVLSLSEHVKTPAATSRHALLTKEWTPLEPGVVDHKVYVRGIGTVREETVKGGAERLTLVSFTKG